MTVKNLKINQSIHKELKRYSVDRDLTISESANILLARGLGILDADKELETEPELNTAA